jgi:hypothetical protein
LGLQWLTERRALMKELEEEMAMVRRRKLTCFQKTHMGVIKKTLTAITTTTPATSTVTPNLTPEELVKFMNIAVASKYGNDLINITHTITEEVRSTLDTFKLSYKTSCLSKLDRWCSMIRVSHRVNNLQLNLAVIPRSEIAGTKPPYVCPGCFIHTYSNNMINRFHVQQYKYLFITK